MKTLFLIIASHTCTRIGKHINNLSNLRRLERFIKLTKPIYIVISVLFSAGCGNTETSEPQPEVPPFPDKGETILNKAANERSLIPQTPSLPSCEERLSLLRPSPLQKSLENYRAALPFIAAETKVYPVVYLRRPESAATNKALAVRRGLTDRSQPRNAVRAIVDKFKNDRAFLREVFLSEGYLFEDNPEIATAMVQEITLEDLFDAPAIYRLRNNKMQRLVKKEEHYIDEAGDAAALYLNDRTAVSVEELRSPIHLDIAAVRHTTYAQRILPVVVDTTSAGVQLIFPSGRRYAALLSVSQNTTIVDCIFGDPLVLRQEQDLAVIFWQRHQRIQEAASLLVAERPLFDEPVDEEADVQEDGELRLAWKEAYFGRRKKFRFREVEYDVFNRNGKPIPPEVCVDFIIDTWERAFGTWYTGRHATPERSRGEIDFSVLENFSRRHIASILTFAAQSNTPFDRFDVPRRNWIPFKKERRFVKNLLKLSEYIREGDLLVIHGLRDEDEQEHFHTVLVLSTDPQTGIPTLVADNQGRPRLSTLKSAMRAAPRRSIKYRLRLDFDKLAAATIAARAEKELAEIEP